MTKFSRRCGRCSPKESLDYCHCFQKFNEKKPKEVPPMFGQGISDYAGDAFEVVSEYPDADMFDKIA